MDQELKQAMDKLNSEKPELSYANLAALRAAIQDMERTKARLDLEDKNFEEWTNLPAVYETKDGLYAYGTLPNGNQPLRRGYMVKRLEKMDNGVRTYEFIRVCGRTTRYALLREV